MAAKISVVNVNCHSLDCFGQLDRETKNDSVLYCLFVEQNAMTYFD